MVNPDKIFTSVEVVNARLEELRETQMKYAIQAADSYFECSRQFYQNMVNTYQSHIEWHVDQHLHLMTIISAFNLHRFTPPASN